MPIPVLPIPSARHTLSPWAQYIFIFGCNFFQNFTLAFSQMQILYLQAGSFFSTSCYMIMLLLPQYSLISQECCVNKNWNEALHGHWWLLSNVSSWISGQYNHHWRLQYPRALRWGKKLPVSSWALLEITVHFGQVGTLTHVAVYPICSQMNIETLRENRYFQSKESLSATLEAILERTEDFTDSASTSHEHRERILELSTHARMELQQLTSVWIQAVRTLFH